MLEDVVATSVLRGSEYWCEKEEKGGKNCPTEVLKEGCMCDCSKSNQEKG